MTASFRLVVLRQKLTAAQRRMLIAAAEGEGRSTAIESASIARLTQTIEAMEAARA